MKKIKQSILIFSLITLTAFVNPAMSQCSMCRAVAESGAKDEKTKVARGLNAGILYLLAMPYIIGGIGFYIWRKNRRKPEEIQ
jgi:hypothetical protein